MTHRDELNAMSNAEFGKWLWEIIRDKKQVENSCENCPIWGHCRERQNEKGSILCCPDMIADWLRSEA